MDTLSIGPFPLSVPLLMGVASVLAGMALHHIGVKRSEHAEAHKSILSNALIVWVLVWKLSSLLLAPLTIGSGGLLGLLYFHGGVRGAALALAAAVGYVYWAGKKRKLELSEVLQPIVIFVLGGYTAYVLLKLIWGDGSRLTLGLLALLGAGVVARWLLTRMSYRLSLRSVLQLLLIFGIGHAVISTLGTGLWEKGAKEAAASTVGLTIGQQAPDFELTDESGRSRKLSELRGQTVVVNFWATWCPPCRAEMPELQAFHDHYHDKGMAVLAVNATNTEGDRVGVAKWLKERDYTLPVVYDTTGEVTKLYRIAAYPATIIVDLDGTVRSRKQGPMNRIMLREAAGK